MSEISRAEIDRLIENDKEWRRVLMEDIKELKDEIRQIKESVNTSKIELSTFKIRVAAFASAFGGAAGYAPDLIKKLFL